MRSGLIPGLMIASLVLAFSVSSDAYAKAKKNPGIKAPAIDLAVSGVIDTVLSISPDSVGKGESQAAIFTMSDAAWQNDTFKIINNDRVHVDWGYLRNKIKPQNKFCFSAELDAEKHYYEVYNIVDCK
jgi:hypothetical protein